MKHVAVSDVYMRLVAECLVHTEDLLLLPVSFGQDSCCIWPSELSLCLGYVGLRDGHSGQQSLIIIFSLWK